MIPHEVDSFRVKAGDPLMYVTFNKPVSQKLVYQKTNPDGLVRRSWYSHMVPSKFSGDKK